MKSRALVALLIITVITVAPLARVASAQVTYRRAVVDSGGRLRLITTSGRAIVPVEDSGQVGFDKVAISPDGRRVGWLALYPNCCTTYPIPLKLVVRVDGKDRAFDGNGLPIWQWAFLTQGRRVAYRQGPVHGSRPVHYELHDVDTRRLLSTFDILADSNGAARSTDLPRWARVVSRPDELRQPQ